MRIAVDTNVLIRAITEDDVRQSRIAQSELTNADAVALSIPALCELVWVLSSAYGFSAAQVSDAIGRLLNAANVRVNRPAAQAGLSMLNAGGDFADGAIAYEGSWLGAEVFVSFDRSAVKLLDGLGVSARLLA